MTVLEKRLIALSALGIRIEHDSGHRWILSTETDYFNFDELMNKTDAHVCKIYGGINEALDAVDSVLAKSSSFFKSLEEYCDKLIELYDYDPVNREDNFINGRSK